MQDSTSSQVSLKTVFTVCFGVLAVCALAVFVAKTLLALALSLTALMVAVALNHLVDLLVRRGLPRRSSILIVFAGATVLLLGLAFTIVPPAVAQGKAFVQQFPEYVANARSSRLFMTLETRLHLADRLRELEQQGPRWWQEAATPVLTIVSSVLKGLATLVTVVLLAILMVIFGRSLIQALLSETLPPNRPLYSKVIDKIYRSIGGYLAGLTLICSMNALVTSTFLSLVGVPFFLPLGLLSGASSLIPYAGPAIAGALVSLVAAVTTSFWKGVACAIYFVVYGQIEGNVLAPLIFRRTVHVNPLVVALSILFLGELAGIFGAVLAVPAAAAVQIVLREILRARRERLQLPPSPFDRPSNPVSS